MMLQIRIENVRFYQAKPFMSKQSIELLLVQIELLGKTLFQCITLNSNMY
jgi:hypothetical protein